MENLYRFKLHVDERGSLVSIEANIDIPFMIKRVYFMYGLKSGQRRGCHAHRSLHQMLICLNGECSVLMNDGFERMNVRLAESNIGLYIPPKVWHEIYDCTAETIIMVLANDYYNEGDYIRNFDEFIKFVFSK
jgi:dTDP-4-dehydrorhamnose 3,5-epimerase-like enzyme